MATLAALAADFVPPHDPSVVGGCFVNAQAFTARCQAAGLDAQLLVLNYPQPSLDPARAYPEWRPCLAVGQLPHYLTVAGDETVDFNACQLDGGPASPRLGLLDELRRHWGQARTLAPERSLW